MARSVGAFRSEARNRYVEWRCLIPRSKNIECKLRSELILIWVIEKRREELQVWD
jgi:hypothetical protein